MKKKIELICDKCGKQPPIDKEKTTKNWTVYKSGDCECGGTYHFKIKNATK